MAEVPRLPASRGTHCSPLVPESHPRRSRHTPQLPQSCPQVAPKTPNSCPIAVAQLPQQIGRILRHTAGAERVGHFLHMRAPLVPRCALAHRRSTPPSTRGSHCGRGRRGSGSRRRVVSGGARCVRSATDFAAHGLRYALGASEGYATLVRNPSGTRTTQDHGRVRRPHGWLRRFSSNFTRSPLSDERAFR